MFEGPYQALGHLDVLGTGRRVRRARRGIVSTVRDVPVHRASTERVSGSSAVEETAPRIAMSASQIVPPDTGIQRTDVIAQILRRDQHVVSSQMKPIKVVQVMRSDESPDLAYLLPHVVVRFCTGVWYGHGRYPRVVDRRKGQETVTVRGPRFADGPDKRVMIRFRRVDHTQDAWFITVRIFLIHVVVGKPSHDGHSRDALPVAILGTHGGTEFLHVKAGSEASSVPVRRVLPVVAASSCAPTASRRVARNPIE